MPPDDTDAAFALLVDKLRALARDEAERLGEPHELPQLPTALPVLWAGPAAGAQPAISVASRRP